MQVEHRALVWSGAKRAGAVHQQQQVTLLGLFLLNCLLVLEGLGLATNSLAGQRLHDKNL